MKKFLMAAAILAAGTAAYATTANAPINVSVDLVETSNLVIMDGATQLTQINLAHNQVLKGTAAGITSPSVATQNFTVMRGDGSAITAAAGSIEYSLAGVPNGGAFPLSNGTDSLPSTLTLARATDTLAAADAVTSVNTITSTIAAADLQSLSGKSVGTYTNTSSLDILVK